MSNDIITTRDMLVSIREEIGVMNDRLLRVEDNQDVITQADVSRAKQEAAILARLDTMDKMIRAGFTILSALVLGLIGLAFFVLQNAIRVNLVGAISEALR